jgi:ribosome-binding protein aMBF1 (putative translation factor)
MEHQDWTEVTVKKRSSKYQQTPTNPEVTKIKKLENNDIYVKPKMFSQESRNTIVQARIANSLSQSDLDARCSFPKNTIQQLEANKRGPTSKELQTLNRILKTGLTLN